MSGSRLLERGTGAGLIGGVLLAVVLLGSPAALASPGLSPGVHLKAPYTGASPLTTVIRNRTAGCGGSVSIAHAPSFNATNGVAAVAANASVAPCGGSRSEASFAANVGLSNANFSVHAPAIYTATALWTLRLSIGTGVTVRTPPGAAIRWYRGNDPILFRLIVTDRTTGRTYASATVLLNATTMFLHAIRTTSMSNVPVSVSIPGLNLLPSHTYAFSAFVHLEIKIHSLARAPSGQIGWVRLTLSARLDALSVS